MLPLVPLFVILGTSFIYELSSRFDRRGVIAAIAVLLAAVPALSMSLGSILTTSIRARSFPHHRGARVVYDRYSDYQRNGRRILGLRMRPTKDTADIVVTANLAYDRFEFYAARKGTVQQTVRPTGSFSCGLIWTADLGLLQSGGAHRCRGRIGGEA